MFLSFEDLYYPERLVKVVREQVVGLVVHRYTPLLEVRFFGKDKYGKERDGTDIVLVGGHVIPVNHPIESVEKILKSIGA